MNGLQLNFALKKSYASVRWPSTNLTSERSKLSAASGGRSSTCCQVQGAARDAKLEFQCSRKHHIYMKTTSEHFFFWVICLASLILMVLVSPVFCWNCVNIYLYIHTFSVPLKQCLMMNVTYVKIRGMTPICEAKNRGGGAFHTSNRKYGDPNYWTYQDSI